LKVRCFSSEEIFACYDLITSSKLVSLTVTTS